MYFKICFVYLIINVVKHLYFGELFLYFALLSILGFGFLSLFCGSFKYNFM